MHRSNSLKTKIELNDRREKSKMLSAGLFVLEKTGVVG
jgi:hypothetical protein